MTIQVKIVIDSKAVNAMLTRKAKVIRFISNNEETIKWAEKVVAAARAYAPVRTGALKASIEYKVERNGIRFTAGVDYSIFVEYGTTRMQAQPFYNPAIDENMDYLMKALMKIIKEA